MFYCTFSSESYWILKHVYKSYARLHVRRPGSSLELLCLNCTCDLQELYTMGTHPKSAWQSWQCFGIPHLCLHDSWLFWFRLFTSTEPQHDPSPHLIHLLTDCFLRTMTISQLPCADISAEVTTHPADPRSNLSISRSCCLRHHSRRGFSHEAP